MLSVTFNQPIVIDAANLHSLLSLANAPAVVTPYACVEATEEVIKAPRAGRKPRLTNGDPNATPAPDDAEAPKAKRTRATKAEMLARKAAEAGGTPADPPASDVPPPVAVAAAEAAAVAAPAAEKPKRDRRSAAKKAADAAAAAPAAKAEPKAKADKAAPAADSAAMLDRFAKLIDSDFDKAKVLLGEFGINRFSDLKAEQHAAFGAKLTELGV